MKREDVEKAAKKEIEDTISYAIRCEEIDNEESNYEAGRRDALYDFGKDFFTAGAEWRINSVWHPATERPKDGEYLTILHENNNVVIEIAPWRNGKYQGSYHIGVYFGCVKVIRYANIYHLLPRETGQ